MNKLETVLINFLGEDCADMPGEKNSMREKGFFACAGSMFAILENEGLTTMTGKDFITELDNSVTYNYVKSEPLQ